MTGESPVIDNPADMLKLSKAYELMISMGMDLDSRLTEAEDIIFNERLRAERKG